MLLLPLHAAALAGVLPLHVLLLLPLYIVAAAAFACSCN